MKVEAWIFGSLTIFMVIVTPVYWLITADGSGVPEITGTVALILTTFLVLMIFVYLLLVARRMEPRPEDKKTGEIAEGAGELGFFPPHSKWPLFEVKESTWLPSTSSASAKNSPSSTQKSWLNRRFRSAASCSRWSAYAGSPQASRANRAPRIFAS